MSGKPRTESPNDYSTTVEERERLARANVARLIVNGFDVDDARAIVAGTMVPTNRRPRVMKERAANA